MEDKMPSDEEINRRYLLVLDHLLVSSSKQEQLIKSETLDKKWRMIKMHSEVYDNDEASKHLRWGDKEIKLIKDVHREKSPDIYKILELKNLLSTSNKEWMVEFIGAGGIISLLNCAERRLVKVPISELDAGILFELLSCFKILTNVSIGMEAVLEVKGSIDVIASSLRFEWKPLVILVLEILSVCCYYSTAATEIVLKGLHNLARSRMEAPMAILANAMLDQDVDVKAAIFQLVNTILGGLEDVQNRGYFRGELMAQRFLELYERGMTEASEESVSANTTKDNTKANEAPHLSTLSATFGRSFRNARQMSFTVAAPTLPTAAARRATSVRYTRNATGALELQQRGAISEKMKGGMPSEETDVQQRNPEVVQGETDSQRTVFASDGSTFIDPLQGVMSGNLYTSLTGNIVKDVFGGKRTKQRWYSLDTDRLSWCADPAAASTDQWQGTLDISTIVDIRHYSTDKYLSADYHHTFEIETTDRTHSFACVEEGDKDAWLTALQVARDSSILKKTSYILQSNVLSPEERLSYLDMLRKQAAVFESIAVEDRSEMIVLNGIDANSAMSIMSYLQRDTQLAGLQPQLLALLQELLLVPTDSVRGAGIWHALVGGLRCLRSQAVSTSTSKDSDPTNKSTTAAAAAAGSVLISNRDAFDYLSGVFGEVSLADTLITKMMTTHPGGRRQSDVSKLSIALDARDQEIKRLKEMLGKTHPEYNSSSSSLGTEEDLVPPRALFGSPIGATKSLLVGQPPGGGGPEAAAEAVVDPKYEMYIKMKKILPEHVLRAKMKQGGLSEDEIEYFFNGMGTVSTQNNYQLTTPSNSNNKYSDDPKYSKFIKMKTLLPEKAVRQKMSLEGFSESDIDSFLNDTNATGSTNENSAPAAAAVPEDPKYTKYDKMCTMFPEAAVRQRMVQDGIVTTEIEAYLSKRSKAVTGTAQPANPPKSLSELDRVPAGMAPKPRIAPAKKMKGFFWTKLPASDVESSIWHRQVPDFSLSSDDKESLQQWFGVIGANGGIIDAAPSTPGNSKNSSGSSSSSSGNSRTPGRPDPPPATVILLEGKRSQNVLIALGKLRLNASQIRESIYKLTPDSLPHESTETLLSILPTAEETALIGGYPRPADLGRAETVYLVLSGIPRLRQRLTCHEIVFRWGYDERATSRDITVLREACKELRASEAHFGQVFGMVLTVGNFLNGGTPRGQAYGFRLEALLKLTNLKCTTVPNGTFLHFVVKQLEAKAPTALRLGTSWNDLWMAGDISVHELEKEIRVLEDQIKFVMKERGEGLTEIRAAAAGGAGWADGLAARVDGFVAAAEAKLQRLKAEMAQAQQEIQQAIARFGEKSTKTKGTSVDKEDEDEDPVKTFFKLISTFGKLFRQSIADVEAERAIAELAVKKEEDKARRRSSKRDDNIFKNFHKDQNARQEDMIARFKERLQRSTILRK